MMKRLAGFVLTIPVTVGMLARLLMAAGPVEVPKPIYTAQDLGTLGGPSSRAAGLTTEAR